MIIPVAAVIACALAAGAAILAVRRLKRRPVPLDRWRNAAETALGARVRPLAVSIERLTATDLDRKGFDLNAHGVSLIDGEGHCWVRFGRLKSRQPLSALRTVAGLVDPAEVSRWTFTDATVDALRPQAPFTELHGLATFEGESLQFAIDGGNRGDIVVNRGTVRLTGLDGPAPAAAIEFDAAGPAPAFLHAVFSPPLDLVGRPKGVLLTAVAGTVEARVDLRFAFPTLPEVDFQFHASVDGLAVSGGAKNVSLTAGRGVAVATNDSTSIEGSVRVHGVPARFRYTKGPGPQAERLFVDLDDAGRLIATMASSGQLSGGRGHADLSRDSDDAPWTGRVTINDVRISRAPLLARLLTAASLPGLVTTLTDEGLTVESAAANVSIGAGIFTAASIRIVIDELTITGDVDLDTSEKTVRGEGLLIPVAGLQRLVSSAPIIGAFLDGLGAKRAPIIATRCTISGAVSEPRITVHPLSSLAPELLRSFGLI